MINVLFVIALVIAIYFTFWCVVSAVRGAEVPGIAIWIMALSIAAVVTRFMGFWG